MSQESQYTPRFLEAAKTYINDYRQMGQVVPTKQGLARMLEYETSTLEDWARDNPEFDRAMAKLKDEQFLVLFNEGLQGKLNPVITRLGLSANHGMAEKSEQDITSKGERIQAISVELVHEAQDPHP